MRHVIDNMGSYYSDREKRIMLIYDMKSKKLKKEVLLAEVIYSIDPDNVDADPAVDMEKQVVTKDKSVLLGELLVKYTSSLYKSQSSWTEKLSFSKEGDLLYDKKISILPAAELKRVFPDDVGKLQVGSVHVSSRHAFLEITTEVNMQSVLDESTEDEAHRRVFKVRDELLQQIIILASRYPFYVEVDTFTKLEDALKAVGKIDDVYPDWESEVWEAQVAGKTVYKIAVGFGEEKDAKETLEMWEAGMKVKKGRAITQGDSFTKKLHPNSLPR